ncbi:DUF2778 domain-containing protein [Methylocystis sp. 9N]|uniref:DUF2778 domain-containing protein n=1 Tax=Methylocystis borbori TaxID=3118750 RepID=A0ABU7XH14_9HYPH
MQRIGAPTYFVSSERRIYSDKSSSRLSVIIGAVALSLFGGVWMVAMRPAAEPESVKPVAFAPNPYGALVGLGGRTQTLALRPSEDEFEGKIEAASHTPAAVVPERQEMAALSDTPDAEETAAVDAPLPPRRPTELGALASRGLYEAPLRRMAARTTVVPATPADDRSIFEKFFGIGESMQPARPQAPRQALAYAGPEASGSGTLSDLQSGLLGGGGRGAAVALPSRFDRYTAVYDISAHTVYMPDGSRLEAHSGLREHLDDPRYVHLRMRGPTPPHVYDLSPREALFHGVEALRLTPLGGEGAIFGRAGLLAHTYMLGPNGDSNGCVSFRDYQAFLRAYKNGVVRRLAVVARL